MTNSGPLAAHPHNLAGLVEYQPGSVVSREVIRRPTGTVTVFAFDTGQGLSEHSTPFDALAQVLDGSGIITIDGSEHRLGAGDAIIMPADRPHAIKASERFKMLLTMVRS